MRSDIYVYEYPKSSVEQQYNQVYKCVNWGFSPIQEPHLYKDITKNLSSSQILHQT